jgi:hypothetical protein
MFWTTNAAHSEQKEEEEDTAIPTSEESSPDSEDSGEEESSGEEKSQEDEDEESEDESQEGEDESQEGEDESQEDEDESQEDEDESQEGEDEDSEGEDSEGEEGVCLAHAVLDLTERVAKAARDDEFIRSAREVFVNQWLSNHDAFLALSTEQLHFLRSALDFPAAETQSDNNGTTELH